MLLWIGLTIFVISVILMFYTATDYYMADGWMLVSIFGLVLGLIIMLVGASVNHEQNKDACESIGGKYIVVDTETTMMLVGKVVVPQEVDVYGCVKE